MLHSSVQNHFGCQMYWSIHLVPFVQNAIRYMSDGGAELLRKVYNFLTCTYATGFPCIATSFTMNWPDALADVTFSLRQLAFLCEDRQIKISYPILESNVPDRGPWLRDTLPAFLQCSSCNLTTFEVISVAVLWLGSCCHSQSPMLIDLVFLHGNLQSELYHSSTPLLPNLRNLKMEFNRLTIKNSSTWSLHDMLGI